jgi:SAM-dependent methyltransferase
VTRPPAVRPSPRGGPPATSTHNYREAHQDAQHARYYDRDFGSPSTAKALNWELEQRILDTVFAKHLQPAPRIAIDFACGAGRVLQYLEDRVDETIGLDISAEMLALAAPRCPRSRLVRHDVTRASTSELPASVDLVTAFRFFLNAEPQLRHDALAWIRSALNPGGHLVANFHLNPASLRGRYLRLRWGGRRRTPMLSPSDAETLLGDADFDVVAVYGYEYLPYRRAGSRLRAVALRRRVEAGLLDRLRITGLSGAFIVVARPRCT